MKATIYVEIIKVGAGGGSSFRTINRKIRTGEHGRKYVKFNGRTVNISPCGVCDGTEYNATVVDRG